MDKSVELTEDMFIDKGTQKAVYAYPGDASKCIKVKIIKKNDDMDKELKYRAALQRRGKHLSMLLEYYGEVFTNCGKGYVFEYIRDFDGQTSRSLYEYLQNPELASIMLRTDICQMLKQFKNDYLTEMVVTSDVDPRNFLVQRLSSDNFKIKIVDNLGTPCMIPLAHWIDFFAKKRVEKYWKRFIEETKQRFPQYDLEKLE